MATKKEAEVMTAPLDGELLEPFIVSVTAPVARRRAGISFGPAPVHLTREQLEAKLDDGRTVIEAIEADTVLVVRGYKGERMAEAEADNE